MTGLKLRKSNRSNPINNRMKKDTIKVVIVDEFKIYRQGLKLLINRKNGFEVAGEAGSEDELFMVLELCRPDVLIINVSMAGVEHEKLFSKLKNDYRIPYINLFFNSTQSGILRCIKNGASGILDKGSSADELFEAINAVVSGDQYLNGPVSRITSKIIQHAHNNHYNYHDFSGLSDREIDVLKLFAKGYSYKEIGKQLFISPRTVETHKNNILKKLNLGTMVDLVKYAIRHELIDL